MCLRPLLNKLWKLQTIQIGGRRNGSVGIMGSSTLGSVQNDPSASTIEKSGT